MAERMTEQGTLAPWWRRPEGIGWAANPSGGGGTPQGAPAPTASTKPVAAVDATSSAVPAGAAPAAAGDPGVGGPRGDVPVGASGPAEKPSASGLAMVFIVSLVVVAVAFTFTRYGLPWSWSSAPASPPPLSANQASPSAPQPAAPQAARAEIGPAYETFGRRSEADGVHVGAGIFAVTSDGRCAADGPCSAGALVTSVIPGSAGQRMGLRAGDEVVTVAGSLIEDSADLGRALRDVRPGARVPFVCLRGGQFRLMTLRVPAG